MGATGPAGADVVGREELVGRDDVVARVHRVVDDAAAGHGSLTLIAGEAGAGKSALLAEAARHSATIDGATAYVGIRGLVRLVLGEARAARAARVGASPAVLT